MCRRGQGFCVWNAGRVWLTAVVLALAVLGPIPRAIAGDRTNVPLKNWGGFSEFKVELASLGVQPPGGPAPPGFVSFLPVDRAQVFGAYANRQFSLVNNQGHTFKRGATGGLTFESRAQIGDFLTFYLQPELLENDDYGAARLATGYAKLTLYNIELLVGRDSLAWGPGYHNALLLSNNAAPLDQI